LDKSKAGEQQPMTDQELDVRKIRKAERHPAIFAAYERLATGESLVLISDHNPRHLRDEFAVEHPRSHQWEFLDSGPDIWRIRVGKLASTSLPRLLCDTTAVGALPDNSITGAVWKLPMADRDLDSNIIHLPPGATIDAHDGPDIDVLVHVIHGSGRLATQLDTLDLTPGTLVWLPRRSRRQFTAGSDGLRYLTVHQRRKNVAVDPQQLTLKAATRS
jgi:uncharacterized protein (DUF2249 family)/quercetin dioxygenase-like cupin family protein